MLEPIKLAPLAESFILRDSQVTMLDLCRQSIRAGNKKIINHLSTGGGKTVWAGMVFYSAFQKDPTCQCWFIVNRNTLLEQAKNAFEDFFGFDCGIVQGNRPLELHKHVQVATIQTLHNRLTSDNPSTWARFRELPVKIAVIDEAHLTFKGYQTVEESWNPLILGLTATPFSKGMGKFWDDMVRPASMLSLIKDGTLSDYRVKAGVAIDRSKLSTNSTGEYVDKEVEEECSKIIGDVYDEWAKSDDMKGRPFIGFAQNIATCIALAEKFTENGARVAFIHSKMSDELVQDTLDSFKAGHYEGVFSVVKLIEGFDYPEVSALLMCAPYAPSKYDPNIPNSCNRYVQSAGRGLRSHEDKGYCISRGTKILTQHGLVNIENITIDHEVWDGVSFVNHGGAHCNGVKDVIEYQGLIATPNHKVMTENGWEEFGNVANREGRIIVTGLFGVSQRFSSNSFTESRKEKSSEWENESVCRGSVQRLLWNIHVIIQQFKKTKEGWVSNMQPEKEDDNSRLALQENTVTKRQMYKQEKQAMGKLRRAWDKVFISICHGVWRMGDKKLRVSEKSKIPTRQDRQQYGVRGGEHEVGNPFDECEQFKKLWRKGQVYKFQKSESRNKIRGQDAKKTYCRRGDGEGNNSSIQKGIKQTKREVWDIYNSGELSRYTANGLLVHNCLIHDHVGNYLQYGPYELIEELFTELDDGKIKKRELTTEERKERAPRECSNCHMTFQGTLCNVCGHKPKKPTQFLAAGDLDFIEGEMVEVKKPETDTRKKLNKDMTWDEKVAFYGMLKTHCSVKGMKQGWAAHKYRARFGVWPNDPRLKEAKRIPITSEVASWIKSQQIRYAKRKSL